MKWAVQFTLPSWGELTAELDEAVDNDDAIKQVATAVILQFGKAEADGVTAVRALSEGKYALDEQGRPVFPAVSKKEP